MFLSYFVVKQRPDAVHHDAKLVLYERGQSSASVSADSTFPPASHASPVSAGDHTGSSSGPLEQPLSKEAVLQPAAFLQEDAPQSENSLRRLHQASPSSAAAGSSFILVFSFSVQLYYIIIICVS